jgi:uncharacterized membrane protein required for colicin V production
MNIDVLMVHMVVDEITAANYVSIALLFKSLAFIVSAGEVVLLSSLVEQDGTKNLYKIIGIILLCTIGAL